jgi:hypothetical protein
MGGEPAWCRRVELHHVPRPAALHRSAVGRSPPPSHHCGGRRSPAHASSAYPLVGPVQPQRLRRDADHGPVEIQMQHMIAFQPGLKPHVALWWLTTTVRVVALPLVPTKRPPRQNISKHCFGYLTHWHLAYSAVATAETQRRGRVRRDIVHGSGVFHDDTATPIKQGTPASVNPEKPTQPQALADQNTTETKR